MRYRIGTADRHGEFGDSIETNSVSLAWRVRDLLAKDFGPGVCVTLWDDNLDRSVNEDDVELALGEQV